MAQEISDATFDETTKDGVTLVDFWAPWCGPCKMMGPVIDKLATEYEGKATIAKLNVDENNETAGKFGVMSIPTLIIFKDGEKVKQFVGVQGEDALRTAIDEQL